MANQHWRSWCLHLFLPFFSFFIFYVALGAYLVFVRHYLPYDSLSRLVSAWLVWRGTEIKLATIGFVWPPLPTLALIPLSWIQVLVESWMALVLVSAFFMAVSVVLVSRILRYCGVNGAWRWLLAALFGLNPLNIVFGVNGMSEAMLIAASLASVYALLRFWDSDRNLHMMLAALLFGLLPLVRYEFALLSAAAGLVLVAHVFLKRNEFSAKAFRDFLEGRLLAFSSLAIYPLFLWCLLSWQIMGNPIYFLINDRSALSLAEAQLESYVGADTSLLGSLWIVFQAWYVTFPVGLLALVGLLVIGWRTRSLKYVCFALLPQLIPLMQLVLLNYEASVPLIRYFMSSVTFGFILVALALEFILRRRDITWKGRSIAYAAAVILVLGSNLATAYMLDHYEYQNIERQTWRGLVADEAVSHVDISDAYKIGQVLPEVVPPGSRILIDTYQFGFGIMLGANDPTLFMDFTDPNYDKAVLDPVPYVDYVIVPRADGRGVFYSVNRYHPDLHSEGEPWATLVDVLPQTNIEWRLYKVNRPPAAAQ